MKRWLVTGVLALAMVVAVAAVNPPSAHADPRDFTLINAHPSVTLTHVFVSASDEADWGDDILGVSVLPPGESVFIYFTRFTAGSCLYDIRVIYEDGDEGYLYKVNLCETDTVTFR